MRPLVAGNWKMNGLASSLAELAALKAALAGHPAGLRCAGVPAVHAPGPGGGDKQGFALGGQDCSARDGGAFTGDISAAMLKDAGASHVIVGHSERRQYHGERDGDVAAKAGAAWRGGLSAIICIGETKPSAMPATRRPSAPASSTAVCRARRPRPTRPSPMSRSGPSAPAGRRRRRISWPCMAISETVGAAAGRGGHGESGFSMADRSNRTMPPKSLTWRK